MGGGGVTAVRVAGKLSRINGGGGGIIGGIKSVTPPEHFMSSPNRTSSSKNVSVVANEDGGGKPAVLLSDSSLHRSSSWEIDDWEFAGVEKERFFDSMKPISRVVFGPVPTLEEAEEATSQLKQALDTVYIDATDKVNMSIHVKESTPTVDYSSGYTETRACVTPSQNSVAGTSILNPVRQAFLLLQTSPECQHAVASIASDKTVWDAITQNPAVQDFMKSSQASDFHTDMDDMEDANESFLDDEKPSDSARSEDDEKHHEEDITNGFTEFMQKIKVAVTDMSSNLYGIVLSIIGGPTEENVSLDSKGAGAAAAAATEKSTAASLMVLAVMAIMVIVLKRV